MAKRYYSGVKQFSVWSFDCSCLFGGIYKMQQIPTKHGKQFVFYDDKKQTIALWYCENGKVDYGWIEIP